MKKISVYLSLTIVLAGFAILFSCKNIGSSSNFEGVVSYEIKADSGLPPEAAIMFKSAVMKTYVKGELTRSEENIAGYNTTIITNSKTPDDPTMLITMFGHKYAVKLTDSLKKLEAENAPKIEYIDSSNATKQIAGYACKKARVILNIPKSAPMVSYLYYTTDLPYADPKGQFKGLKGMPMEFSMNMAGINITINAKSVEKKSLSDSLFAIPSDYKQTSIADMEKDLMKNMPSNQGGGGDSAAHAQ